MVYNWNLPICHPNLSKSQDLSSSSFLTHPLPQSLSMYWDYLKVRRVFLVVLCASMVIGWRGESSAGDDRPGISTRAPAMEGVVIVKFKSTIVKKAAKSGITSFDQLAQQIQASSIRQLFPEVSSIAGKHNVSSERVRSLQLLHELRYHRALPPHLVAAILSKDPNVAFAEPRYLYPLTGFVTRSTVAGGEPGLAEPNDPQYSEMSHLRHVRLPQAWDVVKSSDGDVIISVVDAGTDWQHEDLISNIWRNPAELEDNGIDEDDNGFVDDVHGWNFANETNDPTGLPQTEANGVHGTIVAGIAVAVTDNEEGIAGASWNARLMPVNAGCANSDNAVCYGYEGMLYAAMQGADIINASWGGPDSFLGREVVGTALDLGVLLVVSAGNGLGNPPVGVNLDENLSYPAAYDRVLVVGSTGKASDVKAEFSNYGVSVDVFAPGDALNSTIPDNSYTTLASGTSFSTPIVSGLAALIKTAHPDWTLDQVREQIRVTSDPIDGSNNVMFAGLLGKGRVHAGRALSDVSIPAVRIQNVEILDSGMDGVIQSGETVEVKVALFNHLADAENLTLTLSIDDPNVVVQNGSTSLPSLESGGIANVQFSFAFSDEVPKDHEMNFKLTIEGAAYQDAELIRLIANRATHDTGVLQMSLTDEGNIGWTGFQDNSEGQGFKYLGVDWLFAGGVLIASGPDKISDSIRNTQEDSQDEDFDRPAGSFFGILESTVVAENGLVILNDNAASDPIGLKIHQESYADTKDENNDFIIIRYVISHVDPQATSAIQDLYISLFTDWDLTRSGDYARFDESRTMGIVQPSETEPILLMGTRLLSKKASFSYRSIDNEEIFDSRSDGDGFTNQEKWAYMSEGIQVESVDDTDVSTMITAGPFQLFPGNTVEAAFALMAATSEAELAEFADRAQALWDNTLSLTPPYPVASEDELEPGAFALEAPFPNPATREVSINFSLPAPGSVRLDLFDVLGRKVHTFVNESRVAGRHLVRWDGRRDNGEWISNGVYFCRLTAQTRQGEHQSSQRLVFVR